MQLEGKAPCRKEGCGHTIRLRNVDAFVLLFSVYPFRPRGVVQQKRSLFMLLFSGGKCPVHGVYVIVDQYRTKLDINAMLLQFLESSQTRRLLGRRLGSGRY